MSNSIRESEQPPVAEVDSLKEIFFSGNLEGAFTEATRFTESWPAHSLGWFVLGTYHQQRGDLDAAESAYRRLVEVSPDDEAGYLNLSAILVARGQLAEARAMIDSAIQLNPSAPEPHYALGDLLMRSGQFGDARDAFATSVSIDPNSMQSHFGLGVALQNLGEHEDAVQSLRNAANLDTHSAMIHKALANSLRLAGDASEAEVAYRRALALDSNDAEACFFLGGLLVDKGQLSDGEQSYRRALELRPDFAEACFYLAELLERLNRNDELSALLQQARDQGIRMPELALHEAKQLKAEGELSRARDLLEDLASEGHETQQDKAFLAKRDSLLGDIYDRLGDTESAFERFVTANRWVSETGDASLYDKNRYISRLESYGSAFQSGNIENAVSESAAHETRETYFLIGFPRSGTTLLDTILLSHPKVKILEEEPMFDLVEARLMQLLGGDIAKLDSLTRANIGELRDLYMNELARHLDEPLQHGEIVIDKMPLNIANAGVLHLLFPNARFVFSLRHPCDAILSCFMQTFRLNDAMANFLTLEDSARVYDSVMNLWVQYESALPINSYMVKYESLVENLEGTVRPLIEFLGLDWDASVLEFVDTARSRGHVATPSYNQITQGLYTRSKGRWHRYSGQLAPVLPVLAPWARHFEYDMQD